MQSLIDNAVVGPLAALVTADQAGVREQPHAVGDGRLGQSDWFGEVADASFAVVAGGEEESSRTRAVAVCDNAHEELDPDAAYSDIARRVRPLTAVDDANQEAS